MMRVVSPSAIRASKRRRKAVRCNEPRFVTSAVQIEASPCSIPARPRASRYGTIWAWTNARWVTFFYSPTGDSESVKRFLGRRPRPHRAMRRHEHHHFSRTHRGKRPGMLGAHARRRLVEAARAGDRVASKAYASSRASSPSSANPHRPGLIRGATSRSTTETESSSNPRGASILDPTCRRASFRPNDPTRQRPRLSRPANGFDSYSFSTMGISRPRITAESVSSDA